MQREPKTIIMKSNIELLFRTHYRALCLFATHYIGDISVAEDIVMEAFLHFTERVEQGTTVKEPKSYLFQIVRNSCYNFVRQQRPKCSPVNETTEAVVDDNGDSTFSGISGISGMNTGTSFRKDMCGFFRRCKI